VRPEERTRARPSIAIFIMSMIGLGCLGTPETETETEVGTARFAAGGDSPEALDAAAPDAEPDADGEPPPGKRGRGSNSQILMPRSLLLADLAPGAPTDLLQWSSNKLFVSRLDEASTGRYHVYVDMPVREQHTLARAHPARDGLADRPGADDDDDVAHGDFLSLAGVVRSRGARHFSSVTFRCRACAR
jgi:hypothetical protein